MFVHLPNVGLFLFLLLLFVDEPEERSGMDRTERLCDKTKRCANSAKRRTRWHKNRGRKIQQVRYLRVEKLEYWMVRGFKNDIYIYTICINF